MRMKERIPFIPRWNAVRTAIFIGLPWMVLPATLAAAGKDLEERPNFLWITVEDMSPNLGCYGDGEARTPHLDALARESVRFTRAFATSPVCSAARTSLILGMYASSVGGHHHRTQVALAEGVELFPFYLRQAGYYTTNNAKTDYNAGWEKAIEAAWDGQGRNAHWRGRAEGQPFFSVVNFETTHQSRASTWPQEQFERQMGNRLKPEARHRPEAAEVPPYYPDTPTVRRILARYYDCIQLMDTEVQAVLDELEADGLADDTIVFFFSDHGMGLPRGKRTLYDTGTQVPLLVRVPAKWRERLGVKGRPGTVNGEFVHFVDFGPTMLALAGVEIPEHAQGRVFLGKEAEAAPEAIVLTRDRIDDAEEAMRAVRSERWLYVRNFMPHLSLHQPEWYSRREDIRVELEELARAGKLEALAMAYAGPGKAVEELYDVEADPLQVRNLAGAPEHREVLEAMREKLRAWAVETRDLGVVPEPTLAEWTAGRAPWIWAGALPEAQVAVWVEARERVGREGYPGRLAELLNNPDPVVRYWAVLGVRNAGLAAAEAGRLLESRLEDASLAVRVAAADGRLALGREARAQAVLEGELEAEAWWAVEPALQALNRQESDRLPTREVLERLAARVEREHAGARPGPLGLFAVGVPYGVRATVERSLARLRMEPVGRWEPTFESLERHALPEWLLDAKLGVQFVGPKQALDDAAWADWNLREDRRRRLERTETPRAEVEGLIAAYRRTGARFLVSMMAGAYPGTEGLLMTEKEVAAARAAGMAVGVHYNLLRRGEIPQADDPGYPDWWQAALRKEVERLEADFVFFDGPLRSVEYFQTPEFVAWYYHWAEATGRAVWVNDDWGREATEFSDNPRGDIVDMEVETYDAVPPEPWINWDILRNEWNCWVNEYGIHRRNGLEWEWTYREEDDVLRAFIALVSKGGVWLVQLENTARSWEILESVGGWLEVNGEAIYGTRPLRPVSPEAKKVPAPGSFRYYTGADKQKAVWRWKQEQVLAEAVRQGNVYWTRKGEVFYAIHWGQPAGEVGLELPVEAVVREVSAVGWEENLRWRQEGRRVVVAVPAGWTVDRAGVFRMQTGGGVTGVALQAGLSRAGNR